MNPLLTALGLSRPVFWYVPNTKGKQSYEIRGAPDIEYAKKLNLGVFYTVNEMGDKRTDKGNLRQNANAIRP